MEPPRFVLSLGLNGTFVPKSHKSGAPNVVSVVIPRLLCHLKKDLDLPIMSPPFLFFYSTVPLAQCSGRV